MTSEWTRYLSMNAVSSTRWTVTVWQKSPEGDWKPLRPGEHEDTYETYEDAAEAAEREERDLRDWFYDDDVKFLAEVKEIDE